MKLKYLFANAIYRNRVYNRLLLQHSIGYDLAKCMLRRRNAKEKRENKM